MFCLLYCSFEQYFVAGIYGSSWSCNHAALFYFIFHFSTTLQELRYTLLTTSMLYKHWGHSTMCCRVSPLGHLNGGNLYCITPGQMPSADLSMIGQHFSHLLATQKANQFQLVLTDHTAWGKSVTFTWLMLYRRKVPGYWEIGLICFSSGDDQICS